MLTSYSAIPTRRSRPRERPQNLMMLGALLGGALSVDRVAGGLVGGTVGALATKEQPVPLERALREELARYGAQLVSTYRYGPARVQVLFKYRDQFWTVESSASLHGGQEEIDDWLFGDLVDYQFKERLEEIQRGHR